MARMQQEADRIAGFDRADGRAAAGAVLPVAARACHTGFAHYIDRRHMIRHNATRQGMVR